jgi:hypothetical protein
MAAVKRSRRIRIRVRGQLDGAGGDQEGTLVIDPILGTVTVKPLRKHTDYTISLREVADYVCRRVILGRKAG